MKLFLFSSTHWDREWYKPFQGFRFKLVRMIDDLIDGLETLEDYGVFHFDGQTIVLEDYLEIAPENRARIEALIKKGKLRVGPWYNMPDEYNVSGESLIRNLRRGLELSRSFGSEPMNLGYICDIFGHTAQTPQIFTQFGIRHAALGRGTNEIDTPTFFRWASPDGSEVIGWKLNDPYGYGTLSCNACGGDPLADPVYRDRLKAVLDREMGRSDIPIVLLTDGQDHIPMRRDSSRYLELIRQLYPGMETFHVAIEQVWEELESYRNRMPLKTGELNETTRTFGGLITNTLSSRYDCKQRNDALENRLEKLISPVMALGLVNCRDGFLRHAETFLLRNHPHDSICGCSVAQVHKDMQYRFDQADLIADEIEQEFIANLQGNLLGGDLEQPDDGALVIRIFNPLPYEREGVQTVQVDFPANYPHLYAEPFGYERIHCFWLYDCAGNQIPYGIARTEKRGDISRYTLRIPLTLRPLGVTEVLVKPRPEYTRHVGRMEVGARHADNGILRVEIAPDGTLSLTDHRSGNRYERLLTLLDDADIGDGWYHCNPVNTETVTATSAVVSVVENNENAVTFRVCVTMNVPASVSRLPEGIYRSEERTDLTVTHRITLLRGADRLSIKTTVRNTAMDHRLKLRLPTGIVGDRYTASLPFCFTTRKTGIDPRTYNWTELGVAEKQCKGIVYKTDGEKGLAFLCAEGFHECAVYESGEIDMTMMRCFGKTPNGFETGGQLLGEWDFSYQLLPFIDPTPDAMLARAQSCIAAPLVCTTISAAKAREGFSLCCAEGSSLCYSTADRYGGELCLRFYNPTDRPITESVWVSGMTRALSVRLDGVPLEELAVHQERVTLSLRPYQIVTLQAHRKD